tara:strand:+ start:92 stop:826 length:735 start_codon:yes stop_codon:yes gene_type:complete
MGIPGKMRVLLGSGGNATETRREMYRDLVSEHFSEFQEVVFVPYASVDHEEYTSRMQDFLGPTVTKLVGLHHYPDPVKAISRAEAIYVGGGNSFLLIKELHERLLVDPIKQRVFSGTPYLGVSAGSNVASPTMMTTNDMPIVLPKSLESMGVVPFQINPHYYPGRIRFMDGGEISEHFGETRSKRISEFHRQIETPVLGMWEGSYIQWDGEVGRLIGRATAFRVGEAPVELEDGDSFNANLVQL